MIGSAILRHGTEAQRQRFLKPPALGRGLVVPGLLRARRRLRPRRPALPRRARSGDEFVVNGQKVWTSHAEIADWCFLLCRTEPDAPKHKGISLLLVDMKTPGDQRRARSSR